jgi:hypothetical protein
METPPPSRYNASKEENIVDKQLCPSLQDDRAKSENFAQGKSWWRCQQSIQSKERTVGR